MKQLFWINVFCLFISFVGAQEIGQVVNAEHSQETKNNKNKVIVAFKTTLDSYGLDWGPYGVKPGEGIDTKFNKSMLDWLILSKIPGVDELVLLDPENPSQVFTHLVQWNLSVRKINIQGKVQQFQLSFDYLLADQKNLGAPFYKGSAAPELRTFPGDLIKQVPDVLNKSFINLAVPHWQKIRQTLMAIESSQDSFFVIVKNYKNINHVLSLSDYWKDAGKQFSFDIKLESFDQVQAKLKVLFRGNQPAAAQKVINVNIPAKPEIFPFKLKQETSEAGTLIFTVN